MVNVIVSRLAGCTKLLISGCAYMALALATPSAPGQATSSAQTPTPAQTAPVTQPAPATQPASSAPQQNIAPAKPAQTPPAGQPAQSSKNPTPQTQANPDDQATTTIRENVNEVDLVFTVTDKKGKFVTGLNQSSFGLLDNGAPPEKVLHFYQQTNLPLRVGIMLDTSSSIRGRFDFEQDAAIGFLLQVLHQNDRAFIEGFDVQVDVAQPFTNNVALLNAGVKKLRPGGGTALFDALYSTCRDQMLTLRETGAVRKTLILVSDGDDNYSHSLESDAIKECQRAETTVYTISTNISPSKDKGDDVLQAISDATGGRAFFPTRLEDVGANFNSIQEELRSQYLLQYRPANFKQDGSFRTIYLHATDPRYHVRAHTGYFAPKAAQ
jgi:VWFA-related protein